MDVATVKFAYSAEVNAGNNATATALQSLIKEANRLSDMFDEKMKSYGSQTEHARKVVDTSMTTVDVAVSA